jgi:hypothetical protein
MALLPVPLARTRDEAREYMRRNRLNLTAGNFSKPFCLLWNLGVIQPKPEPEPKQQPQGVNENGVNLSIERDPVLEARLAAERRKQEYGTLIVAPTDT